MAAPVVHAVACVGSPLHPWSGLDLVAAVTGVGAWTRCGVLVAQAAVSADRSGATTYPGVGGVGLAAVLVGGVSHPEASPTTVGGGAASRSGRPLVTGPDRTAGTAATAVAGGRPVVVAAPSSSQCSGPDG